VVLGYNTNTNAPEWLSQLSIQALNISNDLFVAGNITIGGTGTTLDTETITVQSKEILIAFTTETSPTDDTANAAGIAIASTEGYFLADLQLPGINTSPNTYKQFKWFRGGINGFAGQGTDAFISNQPISIGNTQIENGVVFSAGNLNVKSDESTLGVVKISSGIITASEPSGIITYYGELGLGVSIASSIRDSSGSFGSNGQVLAVTSSGLAYTTFTADASSVTVEDITSGTYYVGAWENTGSQAKAYVETTNPVVITSDGRIGIGSTDPTAKLDVDGGVIVSGVVTATDFNSTSDARLKTNIKIIDNPTEKVLRIDGVSFNWIKDNKSSIGVIADNIQEVLPQLVSDTNPKTVNYNGLIGLLIEVVKEQQSQIESLSERISRLE